MRDAGRGLRPYPYGVPRVCVVRQHYVPRDSRVARELSELIAAGHQLDVICLRDVGQPIIEMREGARYWRIPLRHSAGGSALRYLAEYAIFFLVTATLLSVLQLVRRYRLVQVNSVPDVLVLAAVVPRVLGAGILLDLQECMPEFLATKFALPARHPAVRALERLEQLSIRFAHHVITPTEPMRRTFVARGADPDKITVVMDGSDEAIFATPADLFEPSNGSTTFTLVTHGTVEEHYGLDTVVAAIAQLRSEIPGVRLVVYGTGSYLPTLRRLTSDLGVEDLVTFSDGFVPLPELVRGIATADVGVIALKRDPFRDVALPGKIFDFVLLHKPVISSRTSSVEEILGPECVELFESGDAHDLARAVRTLYHDPERRERMVRLAEAKAEPLQWSRQRLAYREVVDRLLAGS
jgi:glycosyltransferase involved in cell wall biosynthesis